MTDNTECTKRSRLVIKRTTVEGAAPTSRDLELGELAINLVDKKLYTKDMHTGEAIVINDASFFKVEDENGNVLGTLEEFFIDNKDCCNSVRRPTLIYPFNGAENVSRNPVLLGDGYQHLNNIPRHARRFQIDVEGENFTNPVVDILLDSDSLELPKDLTLPNEPLVIRIKDIAANGDESEWSCTVRFIPEKGEITNPTISVQGGPNNVKEDPVISASIYDFMGNSEGHESTDWRIMIGNRVIWESKGNTEDLNSIKPPKGILVPDMQYTFSVRYHGTGGSSNWVDTVARTPESFIPTPVIVSPINNTSAYTGDIKSTIDEDPEMVQWELSADPSFTNLVDTLATQDGDLFTWQPDYGDYDNSGAVLYARVRYRKDDSWSMYSNVVRFSVPKVEIFPPDVTMDQNTNFVAMDPVFSTSELDVRGGTANHISTDWKLISGEEVILEATTAGESLTTLPLSPGVVFPNKGYVMYARHNTENYGSTDWGMLSFYTKKVFFESPVNDSIGMVVDMDGLATVTISDITGVTSAKWVASLNPDFSEPFDTATSNSNFTTWLPDYDRIKDHGRKVYIRVVHTYYSAYDTEPTDGEYTIPAIVVLPPEIAFTDELTSEPSFHTNDLALNYDLATPDHIMTTFELRKDGAVVWSNIVSLPDDLKKITLPSGVLETDTVYTVNVKHSSEYFGDSVFGSKELITPEKFTPKPISGWPAFKAKLNDVFVEEGKIFIGMEGYENIVVLDRLTQQPVPLSSSVTLSTGEHLGGGGKRVYSWSKDRTTSAGVRDVNEEPKVIATNNSYTDYPEYHNAKGTRLTEVFRYSDDEYYTRRIQSTFRDRVSGDYGGSKTIYIPSSRFSIYRESDNEVMYTDNRSAHHWGIETSDSDNFYILNYGGTMQVLSKEDFSEKASFTIPDISNDFVKMENDENFIYLFTNGKSGVKVRVFYKSSMEEIQGIPNFDHADRMKLRGQYLLFTTPDPEDPYFIVDKTTWARLGNLPALPKNHPEHVNVSRGIDMYDGVVYVTHNGYDQLLAFYLN